MKIAIVGYGKMGHMIEVAAKRLSVDVVATIDPISPDATIKIPLAIENDIDSAKYSATALSDAIKKIGVDGVIEFSHPNSVLHNLRALLPLGIPIVVGTTGWKDFLPELKLLASSTGGTLLHSANFSLGVNVFYRIVSAAAEMMASFDEYDCAIWEAHHNQKADSPSGTALEIAARILEKSICKTYIENDAFHSKPDPHALHVSSTRIGSVPGTHTVFFDSQADTIELTHIARNREGFANGAVHAIKRLYDGLSNGALKKGSVYTLQDVL